jgi:hypothetical protein
MQPRRLLASAVLLLACTPKPADTTDDTGTAVSTSSASDGAEATSATNPVPTTEVDPSTSSAGPTSVPPQTTASSDDGDTVSSIGGTSTTDTGDDTDGASLPDACADVCKLWDACEPGSVGPVQICIEECIDQSAGTLACAAATAEQWSCVAGLSCEEALKFLDGVPTSCIDPLHEADLACDEGDCGGEIGGDGTVCELQLDCNGLEQRIECDLDVCACEENGVPGKECPADGFCAADSAEQRAQVNACCGFDWS